MKARPILHSAEQGMRLAPGTRLTVSDVTRRFGARAAVRDASFTVRPGSFATLLGPSGCGKTTLLRMIAGLIEPDAGTITLGGRSMAGVPAHRRNIGVVFQRLALFPHLTAAANIAYPLRMRGLPRAEIARAVDAALALVRLEGFGDRRPHLLSGGQQQRVAIARALVFQPALLLLDEPLAALDRNLRDEMQAEFKRIQAETGVTVVNVTHDQAEALRLSDQVLVMEAGRLVQDGTPQDVFQRPASLFVARFIGSPNVLPGQLAGGDAASVAVLRPEMVMLGAAAAACGRRIEGRIAAIEFEGATALASIESAALPGVTLRARVADTSLAAGSPITAGWNPSALTFFPNPSEGALP
jgi:ABC-type Fe3+/spermidine/putrescine transport system ATPase subunit